MNRVVIFLLITGMLIVAYFTYTAHTNALEVYRQQSRISEILASYDMVNLQIKNAFQQSLIYDLSSEHGNLKDYFESEDSIYHILSEIEQLAEALGVDSIPSDSLRPLVARQYLRIEKFRLRNQAGSDSSLISMLDASLADQARIGGLIRSDQARINELSRRISHTGILTPAFIIFLFLFGAGSFAYAYQSLTFARREIRGVEEKLRKNQEILNSEMDKFRSLSVIQQQILDSSEELWMILHPLTEHAEIVDFQVNNLNNKASEIFGAENETAARRIFSAAMKKEDAEILIDRMLDSYESGNTFTYQVRTEKNGLERDIRIFGIPGKDHLILRGVNDRER